MTDLETEGDPSYREIVESRIVEGEIVPEGPFWRHQDAFETEPASFVRRSLWRLGFGAILFLVGVLMIIVGFVLTITIVGALIGIPLMMGGGLLSIGAVLILLGGGQMRVSSFRFPNGR